MIGGPNLRYVRVEPPLAQCTSTTAVTQLTILSSSGVDVQSDVRDSGTLIYIYSIFSSSPDGPSSGTESNLPVSHPTPGIQIVDYNRQAGNATYTYSRPSSIATFIRASKLSDSRRRHREAYAVDPVACGVLHRSSTTCAIPH